MPRAARLGQVPTLLDHAGYLPTFGVITAGKIHDVRVAQTLKLPPDSVLVIDRGYVDYELFGRWNDQRIWFVTRMKDNATYEVVEERSVPENSRVVCDHVIRLTSVQAQKHCPHLLRRIEFVGDDGTTLVFLTNHLHFAATTVAQICKDRRQAADPSRRPHVPARARLARLPGFVSGARCARESSPWLVPSLHRLRRRFPGSVRLLPRYYGTVRLPTAVIHGLCPQTSRCGLQSVSPQTVVGSPGSRARCFRACSGSQTAQGPRASRADDARGVAFRLSPRHRHPGVVHNFRGSIPGLHVPLSTLHLRASRPAAHDSGPVWFATPSPYDSCSRYTSPVFPEHEHPDGHLLL